MEISEIPVVIFELEERTKDLSILCFEKLGFKNITVLDQEEPFSQKMKRFFELTQQEEFKKHELFIRTDADRLVFSGIVDLVKDSVEKLKESSDGFLLTEGHGYECFMERVRGATPHVYSRNLIEHILNEKNELIQNIQKPESHIGSYCKNDLNCFYFYNHLTNLHEFEQYPSKMYNAFLNRIHRGHIGYYNVEKILSDNIYGKSFQMAMDEFNKSSDKSLSLSYTKKDLEILIEKDQLLGEITQQGIEAVYNSYESFYQLLNESYLESFNV